MNKQELLVVVVLGMILLVGLFHPGWITTVIKALASVANK